MPSRTSSSAFSARSASRSKSWPSSSGARAVRSSATSRGGARCSRAATTRSPSPVTLTTRRSPRSSPATPAGRSSSLGSSTRPRPRPRLRPGSPTPTHLLDSVVCVAAEAMQTTPQAMRPGLKAAFERVVALGAQRRAGARGDGSRGGQRQGEGRVERILATLRRVMAGQPPTGGGPGCRAARRAAHRALPERPVVAPAGDGGHGGPARHGEGPLHRRHRRQEPGEPDASSTDRTPARSSRSPATTPSAATSTASSASTTPRSAGRTRGSCARTAARKCVLEDLGSTNGTFHRRPTASRRRELAPGDRIQLGPKLHRSASR